MLAKLWRFKVVGATWSGRVHRVGSGHTRAQPGQHNTVVMVVMVVMAVVMVLVVMVVMVPALGLTPQSLSLSLSLG